MSEFLYDVITSTLHRNYRFHYLESVFLSHLSQHARHTVQSGMCYSTESDNTVRAECECTQQTVNEVPGTLIDQTNFLFISYPAVPSCCKSSQGALYTTYCRVRRVGTDRRRYIFTALQNHPLPTAVYHVHHQCNSASQKHRELVRHHPHLTF
jgi:hypothetical protein